MVALDGIWNFYVFYGLEATPENVRNLTCNFLIFTFNFLIFTCNLLFSDRNFSFRENLAYNFVFIPKILRATFF